MAKSTISRRAVLKGAIVLPFLSPLLVSCKNEQKPSGTPPLKILILGGTSFLGPHQIAYALSKGHSITTFTRGKTKPTIHTELFDQVEMLIGDREDDLKALETGKWDVVIDNSGRKESWTKATAELLKDRVGLYAYTSSTGVYYPYLTDQIAEDQVLNMEMPENFDYEDEKYEYDYGVMKSKSENAAKAEFGEDRTLIIRPTYMIGPGDKTDRFIYWPIRLKKGGEILVPGKENDPVQYIDVRDVAAFMIDSCEKKTTGSFNVVGPKDVENMREFVKKASKSFDVKSDFVYIDNYEFLNENEIPYLIPWIPPVGGNYGSARVNNEKALSAGLAFRPIVETVRDVDNWWNSEAVGEEVRKAYEDDPKSLLKREAEILEKWKNR